MNQDERANRSRPGLSIAGKHATETLLGFDPSIQAKRIDSIRSRSRPGRLAACFAAARMVPLLF